MDVGVHPLGKKKHGYAMELFSVLGGTIKSSKRVNGAMELGAHESFVLYAETEKERDTWINSLNRGIVDHQQVGKNSKWLI
jgi:hypothetical protein